MTLKTESKAAWIRLDAQQEASLTFAIETCAKTIDDFFTNYFEDRGVMWDEEHLPEIRREAEANDALYASDIDFDQFKNRLGIDPNIQ